MCIFFIFFRYSKYKLKNSYKNFYQHNFQKVIVKQRFIDA